MADIKTDKQLVAVLNDPHPSNINFNVGAGVVGQQVKNEGVTHTCLYTPDEAVQVGVTLIQLAHQAAAMGQAQKINGTIPGINSRGSMGISGMKPRR